MSETMGLGDTVQMNGHFKCALCAKWTPEEELAGVQIDEDAGLALICPNCLMDLEAAA